MSIEVIGVGTCNNENESVMKRFTKQNDNVMRFSFRTCGSLSVNHKEILET